MLNRLSGSLLALLLMLAACAPEPTGPGAQRAPDEPVLAGPAAASNTAELEAMIRQKLNELAALTPPDATAYQALFTNLMNVLVADPADLGNKLQTLLQFIGNHAGSAPEGSQVAEIRDLIIDLLYTLVGLDPDANICVLPPGHPVSFCGTTNPNGIENAGFVYFPQDLFEQLTFVSIKALDQAFGVGSGLDEYGYSLEIRTAPISSFPGQRPTVVACVPTGLPIATLNRLLIGHRRSADKYDDPPFSLLPDAGIESDMELIGFAEEFCGKPAEAASASFFGLSTSSRLGRVLARTADFLLPQRLLAANAMILNPRGFSGASGSPEEFSTFRAVDRGVTGAGGSPEEFAPQAAEEMLPTPNATGQASPAAVVPGAPKVTVTTVLGLPVEGVKVSFTLQAPGGAVAAMESNASFSGCAQAQDGVIEVLTDENGEALLPCLNFGTLAGYKKLQVTFDPSGVDELLCMIADALGDCAEDYSEKYLIQTVAGPAAQIAIMAGDNQSAPAYTAVPVAPEVKVTDQYGNPVAGATVSWSANVGTIDPNAGEGSEDTGTTQSGSDGHTALISWVLGAGPNTLLAEINAGAQSVQFNATGTFGLSLGNACVTGGQKDDITKFGFHFPYERNRTIQAIGLHLSSNGAPGQSENYEVTLTATRVLPQSGQTPARTDVRTATARLQSSSNSSKGIENLVIFDFNGDPFPVDSRNNGTVTVRMSVAMANGDPIPANRVVNMNAGSCPAGQLNCNQNQRRVAEARSCDQTESQLGPPLVENYRRAFAGRVYTSP